LFKPKNLIFDQTKTYNNKKKTTKTTSNNTKIDCNGNTVKSFNMPFPEQGFLPASKDLRVYAEYRDKNVPSSKISIYFNRLTQALYLVYLQCCRTYSSRNNKLDSIFHNASLESKSTISITKVEIG